MDGFTSGLIFVCMCLYGAFCAGQWYEGPDTAEQCNKNGEFTVRTVTFKCEPVAAMVNGKRVLLEK